MSMKEAVFGGTVKGGNTGGRQFAGSSQAWLPIKNVINGVVVTRDNRFIKIVEVLPVNIYLKSPNDRQNIIAAYAAYLKIAPDDLQIEVRTMKDNIQEIGLGIASEAICHRFYLVFQYEARMKARQNTVKGIVERLNEEANTARSYLAACELEVLEPRYIDNFILTLLYEIINKKTSPRIRLPEGVFDMITTIHGIY